MKEAVVCCPEHWLLDGKKEGGQQERSYTFRAYCVLDLHTQNVK